METPDDIKQAMKQAFAKDWATRIDEFTDQFKIDMVYASDLGMIPKEMIEHVKLTMEHLNQMRSRLDEWTSDIKGLVEGGKTHDLGILCEEVSEIASQAIATAAYETGIAMGHASDNPTVEQLAEQLSTDIDFMQALAKTPKFEEVLDRAGYEGAYHWLYQYAIWKDGEQYIGCMNRKLKDVLKEVRKFYALD